MYKYIQLYSCGNCNPLKTISWKKHQFMKLMKNLHYWILRFYSSFPYEIISEFLAKTEHDDDDNDDMMMMMNCLSKMTDQQKTLKNVISSWDH